MWYVKSHTLLAKTKYFKSCHCHCAVTGHGCLQSCNSGRYFDKRAKVSFHSGAEAVGAFANTVCRRYMDLNHHKQFYQPPLSSCVLIIVVFYSLSTLTYFAQMYCNIASRFAPNFIFIFIIAFMGVEYAGRYIDPPPLIIASWFTDNHNVLPDDNHFF